MNSKNKNFLKFVSAALSVVALGVVVTIFHTLAFTGPSSGSGIGSGALGTDAAGNVSIGTSTTQSNTKLLILGSTTDATAYGLQILNSNKTAVFTVRNDGTVSIPSTLSAGTFTGVSTANNISSGQFGANTGGGIYSFPASVGIGTTAPSYNFDVVGTADPVAIVAEGYGAASPNFIGRVAAGTTSTPSAIAANTQIASLLGAGYGTTKFSPTVGGIKLYSAQAFTDAANGTYLSFFTTPLGSTTKAEQMRIDSTGNVGIGTTAPFAKLQVQGAGSDLVNIGDRDGVAADTYLYLGEKDGAGYGFLGAYKGDISSGANLILEGNASSSYVGGNVGIGTVTPSQLLEVAGNTSSSKFCLSGSCISAWPSGGTSQWNNNANGIAYGGDIFIGSVTSTLSGLLSVGQNGGAPAGTAIFGYDNAYGVYGDAPSGVGLYGLGGSYGVEGQGSGSSGAGGYFFNNSGPALITGIGSVGIGTATPAYTLDVSGNIRTTGTVYANANGTSYLCGGDDACLNDVNVPNTVGIIGRQNSGQGGLQLGTSGGTVFGSGGNVGINNANPGFALDVAGDVHATGWLRTDGAQGWYSQTYGGGWYMADTTWIRTYNNASVYGGTGTIRTDGTLQVGGNGSTFNAPIGGTVTIGTRLNVGVTFNGASISGRNNFGSLGAGIYGDDPSGSGYGVYGTSAGSYGVAGINTGVSGLGVYGSSNNIGVQGQGNYGVWGNGGAVGVYGTGSTYDFQGGGGEHAHAGVWTNSSDRNLKENFMTLDDQAILGKIMELPVTEWNYKTDKNGLHIGPMAQDFYAIFGLNGDDNLSISTIDPAGVALVGIKALNEKIDAQEQDITAQDQKISAQQQEIDSLENQIKALAK